MLTASVHLDTENHVGPIDRRIFGGFLEHLGRSIYTGVYDPGNARSNRHGFRTDVLEALRPMQMPLVRYPGGNFVSTYDWRDGIGPRSQRPARPDFAWKSIEPNAFGTDEFLQWCHDLGAAPLLAVNLGTLGIAEAQALVEYCNRPGGTYWSDRRIANGAPKPYGVRTWCLGNEMDGPWQAGQIPADEYARRAEQAAKVMRGLDPGIELVAAGSSGRFMSTYMAWDRTVLEQCWDHIGYLSAHRYSHNRDNDSAAFLAEGLEIDRILEDYAAVIGYVRALKRSSKRVHLCFDEWNVWYKNTVSDGQWQQAPTLLEEIYNFEDAIVCAQYLTAFIRRADLVKIACLAQLVNVIGPVLTRPEGVLIQSIWHPFVMMSEQMRGRSLMARVDGPTHAAGARGEAPSLDVAAAFEPESGNLSLTLINRRVAGELDVTLHLADREVVRCHRAEVLHHADLKAANSWETPDVVARRPFRDLHAEGATIRAKVPGPGLVVATVETRPR